MASTEGPGPAADHGESAGWLWKTDFPQEGLKSAVDNLKKAAGLEALRRAGGEQEGSSAASRYRAPHARKDRGACLTTWWSVRHFGGVVDYLTPLQVRSVVSYAICSIDRYHLRCFTLIFFPWRMMRLGGSRMMLPERHGEISRASHYADIIGYSHKERWLVRDGTRVATRPFPKTAGAEKGAARHASEL
jgi:hypothetical protein